MRLFILFLFAALGVWCCTVIGCGTSTPVSSGNGSGEHAHGDHDHADHDHGDHAHGDHAHGDHGHEHGDHPVHGPRDGELIELGEEAYHAEWILDEENGTVTVFVLDGAAKEDVPIEAKTLSIDVTVDGQTQNHVLPGAREPGMAKTALFQASNRALVSLLKLAGKGTEATLTVEIDGETYTGRFVAHEHAHGHAH